jgi:hypothetical protein
VSSLRASGLEEPAVVVPLRLLAIWLGNCLGVLVAAAIVPAISYNDDLAPLRPWRWRNDAPDEPPRFRIITWR